MNVVAVRVLSQTPYQHTGPARVTQENFTKGASFIIRANESRGGTPDEAELAITIFNYYLASGNEETNYPLLGLACLYIAHSLRQTAYASITKLAPYLNGIVGNVNTFQAMIVLVVTRLGGKVALIYPTYIIDLLERALEITTTEANTLRSYIPLLIVQLSSHNYNRTSFVLGLIWALRGNTNPVLGIGSPPIELLVESRQLLSGITPPIFYQAPAMLEREAAISKSGAVSIGAGSYGKVSKTTDGFALKEIDSELDSSIRELATMRTLAHINIQTLAAFGFDVTLNKCLLKMPLFDRDLDTVILGDPIDRPLRRHLGLQILLGVTAMHQSGVTHGDIKPANMLVNNNGDLVLTDFGYASFYHTGKKRSLPASGTLHYLAPEVIRERIDGETYSLHSFEHDMWSVGVTLYELEVGRYFIDDDIGNGSDSDNVELEIYNHISLETGRLIDSLSDIPFASVLHRMLAIKPGLRLTAQEALANFC